jgi:hypothetical protein
MEIDDARDRIVALWTVQVEAQGDAVGLRVFQVRDAANLVSQVATPSPVKAGITSLANSDAVREASSKVIPPKATSAVM